MFNSNFNNLILSKFTINVQYIYIITDSKKFSDGDKLFSTIICNHILLLYY